MLDKKLVGPRRRRLGSLADAEYLLKTCINKKSHTTFKVQGPKRQYRLKTLSQQKGNQLHNQRQRQVEEKATTV